MSDYTVQLGSTGWSDKDGLPSGSTDKIVKGSEFQEEFNAIAAAVATKYDSSSTVDINGGAIDNTSIGATTAASGTFTTLTVNTSVAGSAILDEDDMASNSATKLATQQSIKAYVDASTSGLSVDGITSTATGTVLTLSDSQVDIDTPLVVDNAITIKAPLQNSVRNTIVIGSGAGAALSSSNSGQNTLIGTLAGEDLTTGYYNTALGSLALRDCTTGQRNVAIGQQTLVSGTSVSFNTAVGNSALNISNGNSNTGVGYQAGTFNSSGTQNTFIGSSAGWQNNTSYNTAVGYGSLDASSTSGDYNVAVGWVAGGGPVTGTCNYTGTVFIGAGAGGTFPTTLNNVICIGRNATTSVSSAGGSASNEITLGNSSITSLRCNVTSITSLSDMRDKTNIADLAGASNFIKNLEPVSYDWARRDESMQGESGHGFLAQQLQSAQENTGYHIPGLVFDNNPDKLEAAYGNLLPTVVAALKEALVEIDELKAKVVALENA